MDAHVLLPSARPLSSSSPWLIKRSSTLLQPTPTIFLSSPPKERPTPRVRAAKGRGFGDKRIMQPEELESKYSDDTDVDGDDEIPQVVFDRMIGRIVMLVGTPMVGGMALLYAQSTAVERGILSVPGWVPLLTILAAFGTSAFGIAYGTLSTSWDPEKEGSLLGWEQLEKNWPELWKEEGLQ